MDSRLPALCSYISSAGGNTLKEKLKIPASIPAAVPFFKGRCCINILNIVIPAQAGIQTESFISLDSSLRWNDNSINGIMQQHLYKEGVFLNYLYNKALLQRIYSTLSLITG